MLPHSDTDHTARRTRLSRAPVILFLTAALLLPLSGATAFDADPSAAVPPQPAVAAPAPAPAPAPEPSTAPVVPAPLPASDEPTPAATARHPGVVTGEQLDDAEREAFLHWVAAQQAAGKHRGIAVYTSW